MPILGNKAFEVLPPLSTAYLWEAAFPPLTITKTKLQSRL